MLSLFYNDSSTNLINYNLIHNNNILQISQILHSLLMLSAELPTEKCRYYVLLIDRLTSDSDLQESFVVGGGDGSADCWLLEVGGGAWRFKLVAGVTGPYDQTVNLSNSLLWRIEEFKNLRSAEYNKYCHEGIHKRL